MSSAATIACVSACQASFKLESSDRDGATRGSGGYVPVTI